MGGVTMDPAMTRSTQQWCAVVANFSAGLILLFLASCGPRTGEPGTSPGLVDTLERGELHAGYGVYPPYTQEDPNTKRVSGFSVEVIEEIARQLNVKVVWHRFNWNTMSADLKRGEFDVIADPIFLTIPRAREFAFSAPYAYFADVIPVVRINETRIAQFSDLARSDIRIVVGKGFAAESILKARLPNAKIVSVQVSADLLQLYNMVLSGRADVAINDAADAERFVKEHAQSVKALWLDRPPAFSPAGFALRPDDLRGAAFLPVALRNLQATGVLDALALKYHITTLRHDASQ